MTASEIAAALDLPARVSLEQARAAHAASLAMGASASDGAGAPLPTEAAMQRLGDGYALSLWDYPDGAPGWRYDHPGDVGAGAALVLTRAGDRVEVRR